jgi:hypothetical protein
MLKMSKGMIIALSIIGVLFLTTVVSISSIWSARNKAVSLEERIEAKYVANKSDYDNMWKKFVELTQVSELQANHYKEIYSGLIQGRYEDPKLLFKMVKEDNPKLDSSVYVQIQREISAGRNQFNNNQAALTDMIREYNTFVRQSIIMSMVTNRNKIDPNKYIVTSERTSNAFDTGKDDVINLTGDK